MKTIFLAEGEKHVRSALRLLLENQFGFVISGEARTAESAVAKICQKPPDVILLDWQLPGLHPQRLIAALRLCTPQTLILATSVKPEQAEIALQSGVDGFLSKQLPPDQFCEALSHAIEHRQIE